MIFAVGALTSCKLGKKIQCMYEKKNSETSFNSKISSTCKRIYLKSHDILQQLYMIKWYLHVKYASEQKNNTKNNSNHRQHGLLIFVFALFTTNRMLKILVFYRFAVSKCCNSLKMSANKVNKFSFLRECNLRK